MSSSKKSLPLSKKTFYKSRIVGYPRAIIPIEQKLEMIQRAESGERACEIAKKEGLPQSTVRSIISASGKIREIAKTPAQARVIPPKNQHPLITALEHELSDWYKRNSELGIPISLERLREKALEIYDNLAKSSPSDPPAFTANKEWISRFKRKLRRRAAAAAMRESAASPALSDSNKDKTDFIQSFKDTVSGYGFELAQVFSVVKTTLNYKDIITKLFANSADEALPSDDHVTLLMAANATGDFKLKPLVIHHSDTFQELSGYLPCHYPVIWKSSKKSQLTPLIFSEWFVQHFCPSVKQYLSDKNLERVLLILDHEGQYPKTLEDLSDVVKVLYCPPDICPFSNMWDDSILKHFRARYVINILSSILNVEEETSMDRLLKFQDHFDICLAMDQIANTWNTMSPSSIKSVWGNLHADFTEEQARAQVEFSDLVVNITQIGLENNIEFLNQESLIELLHTQDVKPNQSTDTEKMEVEPSNPSDEAKPIRTLSADDLQEAIRHLDAAITIFKKNDPNLERSLSISRIIENATLCYKQLYRQKKYNQLPSTEFNSNDTDVLSVDDPVILTPAICFYEESPVKKEQMSD